MIKRGLGRRLIVLELNSQADSLHVYHIYPLVRTLLTVPFYLVVNPIALESIAWKYYIVFVVVLIVYGVTVFFAYPETRGYSLEQMAVVFDGDAAEVPFPAETAERSASMVSGRDEKEGTVRVEKV